MTAYLSPVFGSGTQLFNNGGAELVGGKIFIYQAGTSTLTDTWTTSTQQVKNANPIILDSTGRVVNQIWLQGGNAYKFILQDPFGNQIGSTWDNIVGINDPSSNQTQWITTGLVPTYISATQFSVLGNYTTTFTVPRRIQAIVTAGIIYGTISASSYAGGFTTITVTWDSTGLDSGLTQVNVENIFALASDLSASSGSSLVGFQQSGTGSVPRTVQSKEQDILSLFDFLTAAQVADVTSHSLTIDCSAAIQNALNYCFNRGITLKIPGGSYLVANPVSFVMTGYIADDTMLHCNILGDGQANTIFISSYTGSGALVSITGGTVGTQGENTWLTIQGLRIQHNGAIIAGQFGISLVNMAGYKLDDFHAYGFDLGINGSGAIDVVFDRVNARGNNTGVSIQSSGGFNSNVISFRDCIISGNAHVGAKIVSLHNVKFIGGVVEYNGSGLTTDYGLWIISSGTDSTLAIDLDGTYFEGNFGQTDVRIEHSLGNSQYKIRSNFNRVSSTNYTTNNVQLVINSGQALLDLDGSGFKGFGTYVENAARPYVSVLPSGVPTWTVKDEFAIYASSVAAPVWQGKNLTPISRLAAFARFDGTTVGTHSVLQGYNVSSVTRNSVGNYTVTFSQALQSNSTGWSVLSNALLIPVLISDGNASVQFSLNTPAGVTTDANAVSVAVYGV